MSETVFYDARSDHFDDSERNTPSPVDHQLFCECETSEEFFDMESNDTSPKTTSSSRSWFGSKWGYTSPALLKASEEAILQAVKTPFKGFYVNVGEIIDESDSKIWTIVFNEHLRSQEIPIVLVHGLGSGCALWAKNLDELAKTQRTVFAFDVLGFGRSSRTKFSSVGPQEVEQQFVLSIEAWREKLGIGKMIMIGHSLGGYIITSYALTHPSRVSHLILADPWGFNQQPADLKEITHIPVHHRVLVKLVEPLNPLWSIRFFGGLLAPKLIQRIRADLISQFEHILVDASTKISNYIYHCNVQHPPSGESAFHCMMVKFGWSKNPMLYRIHKVHRNVPMTLIYGARSWVDHYPGEKIKELRPDSVVHYYLLDAGHHVYADQTEDFNEIIRNICKNEDYNNDDSDVTIFDKSTKNGRDTMKFSNIHSTHPDSNTTENIL